MDPNQRRGLTAPRRLSSSSAAETPRSVNKPIGPKDGGLAGLFRSYGTWLRRALRKRYGQGAEDLVQEAFLRAARYGEGETVIRHPKALLMRIARNVAADQADSSAEAVARASVVVELADYMREIAQSAEQVEALLLKQLILQMPVTYRDVFVLSRFKGMSYSMISEELGIPIKTVEWRMSKALAYCTEALSDPGCE